MHVYTHIYTHTLYADSEDSTINSFFIAQGGITMPDRTYYLDNTPAMAKHRYVCIFLY